MTRPKTPMLKAEEKRFLSNFTFPYILKFFCAFLLKSKKDAPEVREEKDKEKAETRRRGEWGGSGEWGEQKSQGGSLFVPTQTE